MKVEEKKKRMGEKMRKQLYRAVLLSSLVLLLTLLWKAVIYWVDPAVLV